MPLFKRIFIATCGPTGNSPDPPLGVESLHWARYAHQLLPREIPEIHLGHGRRHGDMRDYLGLRFNKNQLYSSIWGTATTIAHYENHFPERSTVEHRSATLLASGNEIRNGSDETAEDTRASVYKKIRRAKHESVIIADWSVFDAIDPSALVKRTWGLYDYIVGPLGFASLKLLAH